MALKNSKKNKLRFLIFSGADGARVKVQFEVQICQFVQKEIQNPSNSIFRMVPSSLSWQHCQPFRSGLMLPIDHTEPSGPHQSQLLEDRVYRQNDQTWSFRLGREYQPVNQEPGSNGDVEESVVSVTVPSVSVKWTISWNTCDSIATPSPHTEVRLLPSRFFSTSTTNTKKMAAQQKNLKTNSDASHY